MLSSDSEDDFNLKDSSRKTFSRNKRKQSFTHKTDQKSVHGDGVGERFACDDCERHFKYKKGLTAHQNSAHGNGFTCGDCDKNFKTKKELTAHQESDHGNGVKERFPCDDCEKVFKYKKGLTAHQKSEHIKCRWCEYRTQSKTEDIHKHYWSDHKEKVVQEEIDEFNLANGFKKKSQEKHRCGHCRDKIGKTVCTNINRAEDCCSRNWIYRLSPGTWYRDGHE